MQGKRIQMASEAVRLFLKSLPAHSTFNIASFGTHFEVLFDTSQPYSQDNVNTAWGHLKSIQADLGGT